MIIALSGTPGTGKHTVAKEVSKATGYTVIDLGKLLGGGKKEKEISLRQLDSAFEAVKKNDSLVVSHLAHLINSKRISLTVVLRTKPLVLAKRLKKRGYSKQKIYDNVMFEALDGTYIEALETRRKTFQIDNTTDLKRTVSRVIAIINGRGRNDSVDFSADVIKIEKMLK